MPVLSTDPGLPPEPESKKAVLPSVAEAGPPAVVPPRPTKRTAAQREADGDSKRKMSRTKGPSRVVGQDDDKGFYVAIPNENMGHQYVILEKIGSGAFSTVHRGYDRTNHKYVALKIVRNRPNYRQAAKYEIRCLERMAENGVPYVIGLDNAFDYCRHIVMVVPLHQRSLYAALTDEARAGAKVPIGFVRKLAFSLLKSLEALHGMGYMHTDLKVENILVDGSVLDEHTPIILSDFGSSLSSSQTRPHLVCTRQYRAPEVVLGRSYDNRIDIWSVGCILYETATNKLLFPTHSNHQHLKMMERLTGEKIPRHMLMDTPHGNCDLYFDSSSGQLLDLVWPPLNRLRQRSMTPVKRGPSDELFQTVQDVHKMVRRVDKAPTFDQIENGDLRAFLRTLLQIDPDKRSHISDAFRHPFLAGYTPPVQCPIIDERPQKSLAPSPAPVQPGSRLPTPQIQEA